MKPHAPLNVSLTHPKILTQTSLDVLVASLKKQGKRLVFTNGCFDILHPGHVDLLARAKEYGDILFLGINSDESVRRLGKGSDRPINSLASRAFVLAHLSSVDYVIPFFEDTPYTLIKVIQPHVLIKGGDWPVDQIVGADIVRACGGETHSLPLLGGYSTTALIHQIRSTT